MQAALRAGIPVDRHIIKLYMLSAATAGIAGFLSTLRFTAGSAVIGDPLLLSSIAAVIIGGVSLFGGAGTIVGTVIGSLIIAVLTTGLVMLNVQAFWQFIVVGVVVIIAVLIDQSRDLIVGRSRRGGADMSEPVLSIRDLVKRFGGLTAVNEVEPRHHRRRGGGAARRQRRRQVDADQVRLGRPSAPTRARSASTASRRSFAKPIDARGDGIETIYQDLALANNLDVPANIFLGREMKHRYLGGLIKTLDDKTMLREARAEPRDARHPVPHA